MREGKPIWNGVIPPDARMVRSRNGAGVAGEFLKRIRRGPAEMVRRALAFDGSKQSYFVGKASKVSELLHALPMVTTEMYSSASDRTPRFQVGRFASAPTTASFYNSANAPSQQTVDLDSGGPSEVKLARVGLFVKAPRTDTQVANKEAGYNEAEVKIVAAAYSVVREVDKAMAQGTGSEGPVAKFKGLSQLASDGSRTEGSGTMTVEEVAYRAMAQIAPNGGGGGDGPDCLICGPVVLRKLMYTPAGRSGASGWAIDPRTGLFVYHFMGMPVYRTETSETQTGPLYAANLGPQGLHLVYAAGSPETYGLQVDEFGIEPSTGLAQYFVHGGYALVAFENEAIWEVTGV